MDEARFWDRMAKRYHESDRSTLLQRAIDDAVAVLGPDDVVLDLGCASGPVAVALHPHVGAVHGIDISPKMVELARPSEAPGLTFAVARLEDRTLDDRGFTAVLAFNVLHYLDLASAFKRFQDILPPGGRILIQAACLRDINPIVRAGLWVVGKLARAPPMNRFGAQELEARLQRAGFEVEVSEERQRWAKVRWIVARRQGTR